MIKKLRRQFILVAMGSMAAVLIVILASLNAANYQSMLTRSDRILQVLSENDGKFPVKKEAPPVPGGMSVETPYDTRFFSVKTDSSLQILSVDTGRISAVKTSDAIDIAGRVLEKGKTKGFYGNYRYLVKEDRTDGLILVFVDCEKELQGFYRLLKISVGLSVLGMGAVLLLVLLFSKKVFHPVEESYRKQKQFITDASHELKTPITVISANVDLLEMGEKPEQWIGSIRNQIEKLRKLTEQLVTLSRLEEENNPVMIRCSLSELAMQSVELFAPLAKTGQKILETDIDREVFCTGNEESLTQMLHLLLDNALKYTPENGKIQVSLKKQRNGKAKLQMENQLSKDSGIGKGEWPELFERFYRTDASRNSRTGGSGIGLSIVKAIVEQHKGRIRAYSADGSTICFEIIL